MKKFAITFLLAAGAAFAADSWRVNIPSATWVGTTELKPGDYKVSVEGAKATFTMRKESIEVPAKLESTEKKNNQTSLGITNANGKKSLVEIRIGGSNSKIVIGSGAAASE